MLNVKKNRLNYGELLTPPKGYELVKAIGTTYSLDLYALLALPVSMIYSKDLTGSFAQSRYDVLDAIRKSKDMIDLFCQRGKIQVPEKYNSLLAFIEDAIIEVNPPSYNSSFHPKLWILKFKDAGNIFFRLIILSRNLTFDRSWDVAFYCEGIPEGNISENGKNLADYLSYFYRITGRKNSNVDLLNELAHTKFETPDQFIDLKLYPILHFGELKERFIHPLKRKTFDELLIISPFIDRTTLRNLQKISPKLTLISRQEELDLLDQEALKSIDTYCLNSMVVSGEDNLGEEKDFPLSQNLHAKIFIGRKGSKTDWYLGSANSTIPAFERNAEFLLNFVSGGRTTDLGTMKKILLEDQSNLFQPYFYVEGRSDEEQQQLNQLLRKFIHHLGTGKYYAKTLANALTSNYDLEVHAEIEKFEDKNFTVSLQLVHRKGSKYPIKMGYEQKYFFENISLFNLSKFLVLNIYYKKEKLSSIAVMLEVDIPTHREDIIFHNLINNKTKFYQYLQFLLSPEEYNESLAIEDLSGLNEISTSNSKPIEFNAPVYENLLIAASRNPEKLIEVDKIVNRLEAIDSEIVRDFKPIWEVFKEFAYAK